MNEVDGMGAIDVRKFAEQFNAENTEAGKHKLVESVITKKYVPILEKYVSLSVGFNKSAIRNEGRIIFNSFLNYINLIMVTLKLYTNLSLSTDEYNETDCYDVLSENGILSYLLSAIGESEVAEINRINEMVVNDAHENENNVQAYCSYLLGTFKDTVEQIKSNEHVQEEIKKALT